METQTVHKHSTRSGRRTSVWLATFMLLALAAACYWYATEHRSHIAQALMWALILACPLMHLFGHGHGHGGHRHGDAEAPTSTDAARRKPS